MGRARRQRRGWQYRDVPYRPNVRLVATDQSQEVELEPRYVGWDPDPQVSVWAAETGLHISEFAQWTVRSEGLPPGTALAVWWRGSSRPTWFGDGAKDRRRSAGPGRGRRREGRADRPGSSDRP